jgi:adenosylmethionine-8-amino-7-oxononanoate aminotransferase
MNAPLSNSALVDMDQQHMIHPLHQNAGHANARVWVKAEGSHLIDADGNRFIDGLSCLWNVSCGHGRQSLVDAAARQMQQMAFCSSYNGSSNAPAIELADRLSGLCYPQINNFYFTSGGGEATDSNFKLARSYWKAKGKPEKTRVIARTWGYHGVTFAAMCATGIAGYWTSFEPRSPGFSHIPAPDP